MDDGGTTEDEGASEDGDVVFVGGVGSGFVVLVGGVFTHLSLERSKTLLQFCGFDSKLGSSWAKTVTL